MHRANKILMATVAILLCLVLITTSVVSGVFAKYAIKKQASASVGLEKFGVKVTMTPSAGLNEYAVPVESTGESATLSFTGIPLYPGANYTDAIKITFDGIPTVNVKVSVLFHVYYYNTTLSELIGIGGVTKKSYFMPLGFTIGVKDKNGNDTMGYACTPWKQNQSRANIEKAIRNGVVAKTDFESFDTSNDVVNSDPSSADPSPDYGMFKTFDPNDSDVKTNGIHFHPKDSAGVGTLVLKEFKLGFEWPLNYTGTFNYDEIGAYLAQNYWPDKPFRIWYTVTLEQV